MVETHFQKFSKPLTCIVSKEFGKFYIRMKYTGEIDLYIYVRKEEASSSPSSEETHAIYDFQDFYVKRNYPKRL